MWAVICEVGAILTKFISPNYINEGRGIISSSFRFCNNWSEGNNTFFLAYNSCHGPCLTVNHPFFSRKNKCRKVGNIFAFLSICLNYLLIILLICFGWCTDGPKYKVHAMQPCDIVTYVAITLDYFMDFWRTGFYSLIS